jgi:copper(I)-binding protein
MEDSVLYIPYLFPLRKDYWSGEKIKVQLFIPKGKKIIIEEPFTWKRKVYSDFDIDFDLE